MNYLTAHGGASEYMLSDQLKEETKQAHQTLEKRLISKIKAIHDPAGYVVLLRLFYGFYHGLEERIAPVVDQAQLTGHQLTGGGRKSSLILDDIGCFISKPPYTVPAVVELPEVTDHLQAMGALYVLEGSTLGGKIIARMIAEKLGIKGRSGITFFEGYGEKTWKNWEIFKQALDLLPRNAGEAVRVISAANDTFDKFNTWVDKYESEN